MIRVNIVDRLSRQWLGVMLVGIDEFLKLNAQKRIERHTKSTVLLVN